MERGNLFFVLITIAFFISACVKDVQDIPDGVEGNPVFKISGQLGTETVDINAGLGGWTMQPIVEGLDSTLVYTSFFSQNGCLNNCSPSLEFRFHRDFPFTGNDQSDFEQAVRTGAKEFIQSQAERDSFNIILSTHPALFMSGFSVWEDVIGNSISFETEYAKTFGFEENMNVCFQSLAFTGCKYIQCIYFDPSTLVPCISYIQPDLVDGVIRLTVRPEGTPPFDITWFNETKGTSILLPVYEDVQEIFASVSVTDALGNQSMLSQSIRIQNGNVDACYFPIDLSSVPVSNIDPALLADKVEIIYTDADGGVWTSTAGEQDQNSSFTITNVEFFDQSPLNEPAYKVDLAFGVILYNTVTGEEKYFSSQDAVIALAHR